MFVEDITTSNGKAKRAKAGDKGRIIWVFKGRAVVRRDGMSRMINDVPVSALKVIE